MTHNSSVISAFSEEDVGKLTRISRSQLRYWDRTGFFVPSLGDLNRRRAYSRIYSFRDLVSLQILNELRNEARVSLQHLREVKEKLAHLGDDLWAKTTLYVLNRKVVFDNPETKAPEEVVSGQAVLQIPLKVVHGKMEDRVRSLWKRDKATIGIVHRKRGVAHSNPVIAGTRIPVNAIQSFAKAGFSVKDILKEYPILSEKDIEAALKYKTAA